eukprot:3830261-Amphidinium_carterae.1
MSAPAIPSDSMLADQSLGLRCSANPDERIQACIHSRSSARVHPDDQVIHVHKGVDHNAHCRPRSSHCPTENQKQHTDFNAV